MTTDFSEVIDDIRETLDVVFTRFKENIGGLQAAENTPAAGVYDPNASTNPQIQALLGSATTLHDFIDPIELIGAKMNAIRRQFGLDDRFLVGDVTLETNKRYLANPTGSIPPTGPAITCNLPPVAREGDVIAFIANRAEFKVVTVRITDGSFDLTRDFSTSFILTYHKGVWLHVERGHDLRHRPATIINDRGVAYVNPDTIEFGMSLHEGELAEWPIAIPSTFRMANAIVSKVPHEALGRNYFTISDYSQLNLSSEFQVHSSTDILQFTDNMIAMDRSGTSANDGVRLLWTTRNAATKDLRGGILKPEGDMEMYTASIFSSAGLSGVSTAYNTGYALEDNFVSAGNKSPSVVRHFDFTASFDTGGGATNFSSSVGSIISCPANTKTVRQHELPNSTDYFGLMIPDAESYGVTTNGNDRLTVLDQNDALVWQGNGNTSISDAQFLEIDGLVYLLYVTQSTRQIDVVRLRKEGNVYTPEQGIATLMNDLPASPKVQEFKIQECRGRYYMFSIVESTGNPRNIYSGELKFDKDSREFTYSPMTTVGNTFPSNAYYLETYVLGSNLYLMSSISPPVNGPSGFSVQRLRSYDDEFLVEQQTPLSVSADKAQLLPVATGGVLYILAPGYSVLSNCDVYAVLETSQARDALVTFVNDDIGQQL